MSASRHARPVKSLCLCLLAACLVGGCAVSQKNRNYTIGLDTAVVFGTTLAEVETKRGVATLRRGGNGVYSIRFGRYFQVYELGKFDRVKLLATAQGQDDTAMLLQTYKSGCLRYQLLTVNEEGVYRHDLKTSCNQELAWEADEHGQLAMMETETDRPKVWQWKDGILKSGRRDLRAEQRQAEREAKAATKKKAPTKTRTAKSAAAKGKKTRTQRVPSSSASQVATYEPPPQPYSGGGRIVIPDGTLQTEAIQPVKVRLYADAQ